MTEYLDHMAIARQLLEQQGEINALTERAETAEAERDRLKARGDFLREMLTLLSVSHVPTDQVLRWLDRPEPPSAALLAQPEFPLPIRPDGTHWYVSTGCGCTGDKLMPDGRTGHQYCQDMTGYQGAKRGGQAKCCGAPCQCPCHQSEPSAEGFGWHVLSLCPDETACSIHGRNEGDPNGPVDGPLPTPATQVSALARPATRSEEDRAATLTRIRQAWVALDDAGDRLAAVGMAEDRWRQIIEGERRPTSLDLALIATAFGVTVDWLLTGTERRQFTAIACNPDTATMQTEGDVAGPATGEQR